MIEIRVSPKKMKEIEEKHWIWFKTECLPKLQDEIEILKNGKNIKNVEKDNNGNDTDMKTDYQEVVKNLFCYLCNIEKIDDNILDKFEDKILKKIVIGNIKELNTVLKEMESKKILDGLEKKEISDYIQTIFSYDEKLKGEINFSNYLLKEKITKIEILDFIKEREKSEKYRNEIFQEVEKSFKVKFNEEEKKKTNKKDIKNNIKSKIKEKIENLKKNFNYNEYKKIFPNEWGKYQLIYELGITVCPYCNRNFISTIYIEEKDEKGDNKKGKARADLDHFLPKSKYPFLAVSLYNLIPSCKVCNSSLKGQKEFSYEDNLNPYEAGAEKVLKFTTKSFNPDYLLGNSDDFIIDYMENINKQEENKNKEKEEILFNKAKRNIEVLRINEFYQSHKDYIRELIRKAIVYNESRIDELFNEYEGTLFKSREDVVSMIVSNYIDDEDLDKRVLAKLTKDISEELGLK